MSKPKKRYEQNAVVIDPADALFEQIAKLRDRLSFEEWHGMMSAILSTPPTRRGKERLS